MFTPEVANRLGSYVYRLIDPRNGQTFYVGKGKGNRVFSHAKGDIGKESDEVSDKMKRIQEIKNDGFEVSHIIHRHGLDEKTAIEVEAALIDAYPEVTNKTTGHYSNERGIMHAQQVVTQYQAEEIPLSKHKVLMLSINESASEANGIYEATRYAWKLDDKRAKEAEFILALQQGLVIGVFIAEDWMEATQENFPGRESMPKRWGFIGKEADKEIQNIYLRKRLPDDMRKKGAANPIRYSYK